ncbi:MAG: hypothetical protein AB9836_08330 [Aminipila sp.]
MADLDRELGWDDEIEKDGGDFVLLPDGDYNFEIIDFERGRHPGSEKLPSCNKATLHIRIVAPEGTITLQHNLFLHSKTEGMLSAFFASIGQKKKGEKAKMNWSAVTGSTGRLKLGSKTYTKDGEVKGPFNEIKKFYEYEGSSAPEGFSQVGGYTAGEF